MREYILRVTHLLLYIKKKPLGRLSMCIPTHVQSQVMRTHSVRAIYSLHVSYVT